MTDRPTFTSVFEETETAIKNRMVNSISDEWRKDPGDFMHDAVVPNAPEVKQLEVNQDYILKNGFAAFAEGYWLDLRLGEIGEARIQATYNKRALSITADAGVVIPKDYELLSVVMDKDQNPIIFMVDAAVTFDEAGTKTVNITCQTSGTIANLATYSQFTLSPALPGISSIVDLGTTTAARDVETDAEAWARYDFLVTHPDTGGNKHDYVRWVQEEFEATVGKSKAISRWDGVNTVKVILVGIDYKPASDPVVAAVQTYLDPGITGQGDGKAPGGAAVTVIKAAGTAVNIAATVTWSDGADEAAGLAAFSTAVANYFKALVFSAAPNVVYNKIGALLTFTEGVSDYSGLTLNGGTADIAIGAEAVATLGTVVL